MHNNIIYYNLMYSIQSYNNNVVTRATATVVNCQGVDDTVANNCPILELPTEFNLLTDFEEVANVKSLLSELKFLL